MTESFVCHLRESYIFNPILSIAFRIMKVGPKLRLGFSLDIANSVLILKQNCNFCELFPIEIIYFINNEYFIYFILFFFLQWKL